MEIQGRIIVVLPLRAGTSQRDGKPWATQDYVIETIEQFPRRCVFNVFGEGKIREYNLQIGSEVKVSFDINAREYNGRWYNDVRAWKVEPLNHPQEQANTATIAPPVASMEVPEEKEDDLPF